MTGDARHEIYRGPPSWLTCAFPFSVTLIRSQGRISQWLSNLHTYFTLLAIDIMSTPYLLRLSPKLDHVTR